MFLILMVLNDHESISRTKKSKKGIVRGKLIIWNLFKIYIAIGKRDLWIFRCKSHFTYCIDNYESQTIYLKVFFQSSIPFPSKWFGTQIARKRAMTIMEIRSYSLFWFPSTFSVCFYLFYLIQYVLQYQKTTKCNITFWFFKLGQFVYYRIFYKVFLVVRARYN